MRLFSLLRSLAAFRLDRSGFDRFRHADAGSGRRVDSGTARSVCRSFDTAAGAINFTRGARICASTNDELCSGSCK
jgi:hypothetical protein